MRIVQRALAATCCLLASATALAAGNTLFAANNGVDSGVCGPASAPCRSISQAIVNAASGDTVLVKPGIYGDIDGDGQLASFGEETGTQNPAVQSAVNVNKPLTVLSTAGATATHINIGTASPYGVGIYASGVRFGEKNAGFTVTGAQAFGIYTENVTNVVIAGNIARNAGVHAFFLAPSGFIEARNNVATGAGGVGFAALTNDGNQYVILTNNVAYGNNAGILVSSLAAHRVTGNDVFDNDIGMAINYGPARIANNRVTGNRTGMSLNGFGEGANQKGPQITRNDVVGNRANGIDVFPGPPGVIVKLRENNIYGNGNCGTTNQSQATLDARSNFWGAATGPSFTDPADAACPGAQPTLTAPFSANEFPVR